MTLNNINKIEALKSVNVFLDKKIDELSNSIEKIESELLTGDNLFINDNGETNYQIIRFEKDYNSDAILNNEFKRIICLKGIFTVNFPDHNDDALVHSPNTILIPPKTSHIIKALDNCEVLIVYKPNFSISGYKIMEENTIYKKEKY
jgi:hypothetical protein